MNLLIEKTDFLTGTVRPPSSKSQTIRALIIGLMGAGTSAIHNPLYADDSYEAITICKQLGAVIHHNIGKLTITSTGLPLACQKNLLKTGNSGITTRFIIPILGLRRNPEVAITLDCGEQMRMRPIAPLVIALRNLGLQVVYVNEEGKLPITITGQLRGGQTEISGFSSQYLSALLLSLPCAPDDSEITVSNLHERPYVELTLNWLTNQGIQFTHTYKNEKDIFSIQGQQSYQPFSATIPGDFSSASYLLAAGAMLPGEVTLEGLDMADTQGDKQLVTLLQEMGADIKVANHSITLKGGKPLQGVAIDANAIPDLLPTLAVLGTYATGKTEIYNVKQARIKETDRIHSMMDGLTRLGAHIEEKEDGLVIYPSKLTGTQVKGFGDHRTVMALSLAGLLADGLTIIDDSEAINKTFPTYVDLMKILGAKMEMKNE